jgi:hypothetical protein
MYIINKGQNSSWISKLNILYKEKNVYIMDNHLAAIWCWYQMLDLSKKYSFLHIDRHYDLGINLIQEGKDLIKNQKIDIKNIPANLLTDYKVNVCNTGQTQLFVWDNYINLFKLLNPKVIEKTIFSTQDEGTFNYKEKNTTHKESWKLQNELAFWIGEKDKDSKKWIVNLDIDYFFAKYDCTDKDCDEDEFIFQYLTDEFIRTLCREIKKQLNSTIEILTIAMSPECCGGWAESIRITNLVAEELGLEFKYK